MGKEIYNNRGTITVCGHDFEVAASNGACFIYASEFKGKEKIPYSGSLVTDFTTEISHEMMPLINEGVQFAPTWFDMPHVLQCIWAMAKATGSTKKSWKEFKKWVENEPVSIQETIDAIAALGAEGEIGKNTFFRNTDRSGDSGKSNETKEEK